MQGKLFAEFFIGLFSINPILTLVIVSILPIIVLIVVLRKMNSPLVDKKDLATWIFLLVILLTTLVAFAYLYLNSWY